MHQDNTPIGVLKRYISQIIDEHFPKDEHKTCKVQFILSILGKSDIVVTISHMGYSYSAVLALEENIEDVIESLFNKTI